MLKLHLLRTNNERIAYSCIMPLKPRPSNIPNNHPDHTTTNPIRPHPTSLRIFRIRFSFHKTHSKPIVLLFCQHGHNRIFKNAVVTSPSNPDFTTNAKKSNFPSFSFTSHTREKVPSASFHYPSTTRGSRVDYITTLIKHGLSSLITSLRRTFRPSP